MPNNFRNQPVDTTAHFDNEKENIINDSLATANTQIGVQTNGKKRSISHQN